MPPHPHLEKEQAAQIVEAIFALRLARHEARGHSVTLGTPPSPRYAGAGGAELVDGMSGDANDLQNDWLGFEGDDLKATIDLGEAILIDEVGLATCQVTTAGVFLPPTVVFEVSSDGEIYQELARIENDLPLDKPVAQLTLATRINPVRARYLRVHARNLGTIPDWHPAKGREAWLFAGEILVNPRH
jgi:hexosaminidase